jgi:hypothetical protein
MQKQGDSCLAAAENWQRADSSSFPASPPHWLQRLLLSNVFQPNEKKKSRESWIGLTALEF